MIQDIDEKFHPEWKNVTPEKEDKILVFQGRSVCLKDGRLPYYSEVKPEKCIYAFAIGEERYFLSLVSMNLEFTPTETFRTMKNRKDAFAIATGYHLYLWYKDKRYCPSCRKEVKYGTDERKLVCDCGYTEYPKICPAVIVGIIHKGRILLTKYSIGYSDYALVAGYCEIGETFEDTVHREVMEETGLRVKNLKYYKSQPWGMSGSVLAGFFCEAEDDSITLDNFELKEARFFSKEEIELRPDNTSLTREMILFFKNGSVDL